MKYIFKNVKTSMIGNIHKKLFSTQQTTVQPWVEVENRIAKLKSELVLKKHGQIEKYKNKNLKFKASLPIRIKGLSRTLAAILIYMIKLKLTIITYVASISGTINNIQRHY